MSEILDVPYNRKGESILGIETLSLSELQRRAGLHNLARVQRIQFFLLLLFTEGTSEHMVDFVSYPVQPNTLMLIKPGQVQQFHIHSDLAGRLIVIDPSFLLPERPTAEGVPPRLWWSARSELPDDLARRFLDIAASIHADSQKYADHPLRRPLLQHQLYTLLLSLRLASEGAPAPITSSRVYNLVSRYKQIVEENYLTSRSIPFYAQTLGSTERTLTRACLLAEGQSAKVILDRRILLEAKRLLAYTRNSVTAIAQHLGFSETTNFIRFFKRYETVTPAVFRDRHTIPE